MMIANRAPRGHPCAEHFACALICPQKQTCVSLLVIPVTVEKTATLLKLNCFASVGAGI